MTEQTDEPTGTDDRGVKLKQAYSAATTRLREEKRSEFDKLYAEEAEKRGVTYTPKQTPEQKAAQELQEILTNFPHLREQFSEQPPEVSTF